MHRTLIDVPTIDFRSLVEIEGSPWKWVYVDDLVALHGKSAQELWDRYCSMAHRATLAKDWDGSQWTAARVSAADGSFEIFQVWEMLTGERFSINTWEIGRLLLPAAWSNFRSRKTDRLEKVVNSFFQATYCFSLVHVFTSFDAAICAADEKRHDIGLAFQYIDKYCDLELVLAQLCSGHDKLILGAPVVNQEKSTIKFSLSDTKRPERTTLFIVLRVVLGSLKLLELKTSVCKR